MNIPIINKLIYTCLGAAIFLVLSTLVSRLVSKQETLETRLRRKILVNVRDTLSGIFIFGTIISLAALITIGRFGLKEIQATAVLMPGVFLGFFLSNRSTKILDRGFIRPAVLITSAISGLVVILRNLF